MSEEILTAVKMPEITIPMAMIIVAGMQIAGKLTESVLKARNKPTSTAVAKTSAVKTTDVAGWGKISMIALTIFDGVVALGSLVLLAMLMRSGVPLTTGGAAVIAGLCTFFIVSSLRQH